MRKSIFLTQLLMLLGLVGCDITGDIACQLKVEAEIDKLKNKKIIEEIEELRYLREQSIQLEEKVSSLYKEGHKLREANKDLRYRIYVEVAKEINRD